MAYRNKIQGIPALLLGLFFVLQAVILPAAPAEKTETGDLVGFMYQADGETPLQDAQLVLEEVIRGDKTGKEFRSNITGSNGEYKMENIPVGVYKGKIMLSGKRYKIKKIDFFFHIFPGKINHCSFSLKKGSRKRRIP